MPARWLAGPTRAGEFWRAVTALTLHLDVGHLLANLGFGIVFGLLAGQLLGAGRRVGHGARRGGAANLLNAFIQPATHSSVGASTAVFATLGLLAAYAWRRRARPGRSLGLPLGTAGRRRDPARLHRRRRRAHGRARAPDGVRHGCARGRRACAVAVPRGRVAQVVAGLPRWRLVVAWVLALAWRVKHAALAASGVAAYRGTP